MKNKSGNGRKIAPAKHTTQLPRLKRIEGQVRGIKQMIENERNLSEPYNSVCCKSRSRLFFERVWSGILGDGFQWR